MIRFSYDCPAERELPFMQFSIEGDNLRGYLLLAWDDKAPRNGGAVMLQKWFDTLGQALDHCDDEYGITRNDWAAPTVGPPSTTFRGRERGRRRSSRHSPQTKDKP